MMTASVTIGPMTLVNPFFWGFDFTGHLCRSELNLIFNVPRSATSLWVTITSKKPRHGDAVRIRPTEKPHSIPYEYRRFDDQLRAVQITAFASDILAPFGDDCYATSYYE